MIIARAFQLKGRVAAPRLAGAFLLAAALVGALLQAPAAAQPLSAGCEQANAAIYDGVYGAQGFTNSFFAGEQLTVNAVTVPGSNATGFTLAINGSEVMTVNLPGTATYTFPASASFAVLWQALPLPVPNASFTVSCTAAIAATFRGLSATNTRGGVLVRWRTASEVDVLGFHVYRAVQGKRVRANGRLIPAHGAGAYSFLDRLAPRAKALRYWIQLVNLDGSRSWYGPAPSRGRSASPRHLQLRRRV